MSKIADLLKIVERDLEDSAQTEISDDWQFVMVTTLWFSGNIIK
jgi:hypothetical protein